VRPSLVELAMARREQEHLDALESGCVSELNRVNGRLGGRPPTLTNAILASIGRNGTGTALELSRELQHDRKAIGSALHRLLDEGRVRKVAYGVFALPEAQ
jgi:predicted HTH transcriptional regulator